MALCGIRGIPACYGGFETFAERLSVGLVERGHAVTVYGRRHVIDYPKSSFKGVAIRLLWAPKHKYLETPVHTINCLLDLVRRRREFDVVLVCNAANSPFVWIARLFGLPLAVNVDGIERHRSKWNAVGKLWYRLGEFCSVLFASEIVADADVIAEYYRENYSADSTVIRYGHDEVEASRIEAKLADRLENGLSDSARTLYSELGLRAGQYLLYVSRLEPENNAHVVIDAYNRLPDELKDMPLVVVGDAPYADDYIAGLKRMAGPGVIFTGYRFGDDYHSLQYGAYLYIQATEVGGTHPALVEAMGFANCVIVNGTPENIEVLGDAGFVYQKNDARQLSELISTLRQDVAQVLDARAQASERARELFNWAKVVSDYEQLFSRLSQRFS